MKMEKLKQIVLTENNGFVVKGTLKPVEILGGYDGLGVVMKKDASDEELKTQLEDYVFRFSGLKNANGYILHGGRPVNDNTERMVGFSVILYKEK